MEFGRLEPKMLKKTNFRLPAEPPGNNVLLGGKPAATVTWLGNAKWGRREWVGKLYPPKTPQRRYLSEYTRFYNSIELNATHYKIYGAAGIASWAAEAGSKPFLFCPKMYQGITHRGKPEGKAFLTGEFLRGVAGFAEHLGPIFMQFPDSFGPSRNEELFRFLRQLPKGFRFFLELRHPAWFSSKKDWQELLALLTNLKIGMVITDTAGRRDCCHMHLTVPAAFIRFVGNSLDVTDYSRCDAWVKRIAQWQNNGLKEVFFFMHMHDETYSPELSAYLAKKLNEVLQVPVQVPEIHPELAAKPGKPRGINEKFSAELEAALVRRTKNIEPENGNDSYRKTMTRKKPAPKKAAPKKSVAKKAALKKAAKKTATAKKAAAKITAYKKPAVAKKAVKKPRKK